MEQQMVQSGDQRQVAPCRCGRVYTHCMACGQRKPYIKKKRSAELSFELGYRVWVYSCTNCPVETHSGMECQAPSVETGAGFENRPYQKPLLTESPLWGNAIAGSNEHGALLSDWVVEKQRKYGWDSIRVYVEAQKAGWHLEAFGDRLEEDVKQALIERGLLDAGGHGHSGGESAAQVPAESEGQAQAPSVSLDDIIKNLQEDSK